MYFCNFMARETACVCGTGATDWHVNAGEWGYWDKEFSTSHMMQSSPLSNLVMVNGLIVDKRSEKEVRHR